MGVHRSNCECFINIGWLHHLSNGESSVNIVVDYTDIAKLGPVVHMGIVCYILYWMRNMIPQRRSMQIIRITRVNLRILFLIIVIVFRILMFFVSTMELHKMV